MAPATAKLPETGKAAVLTKHCTDLQMQDHPIGQCGAHSVIVKLVTSGVCHTDLHVQAGDWEVKSKIPVIPGHEGVGHVVAAGSEVTDLKIGDRVCLPWLKSACGNCTDCIRGWENCCPKVLNSGFTADGCFAEYVHAPAAFATLVPEKLSNEQAAPITCAGVTVYKALKETCARAGQWVVIIGAAGGLGHLAVQYAKFLGLKVIGIDVGAEKMKYLQSLKCDLALDPKTTANMAERIQRETGGGCHGAVILSAQQTAVRDTIPFMRPRGVVVPIALPPGNMEASYLQVIVKALRIQGSIVGTREDLKEALQIAAEGHVHCSVEIRPFSAVNKALHDLSTGNVIGRLVLDMQK